MVIRSLIIRLTGWLFAQISRLWLCTLRVHCEHLDAKNNPAPRDNDQRRIYCFGHADLLTREYFRDHQGIGVLISPGGDGVFVAREGTPMFPVGVAYERPWRLASWDKLVLPRPFSRVVICFGPSLKLPAAAEGKSLEEHRLKIAALIAESTRRAEALLRRWRKGETLPLVSPEAKALEAMPLRKSA
jgi:lysophospholipid acyltransferase (LPLAT)-like uncharacterized protein